MAYCSCVDEKMSFQTTAIKFGPIVAEIMASEVWHCALKMPEFRIHHKTTIPIGSTSFLLEMYLVIYPHIVSSVVSS